jgi:hypothetical protein
VIGGPSPRRNGVRTPPHGEDALDPDTLPGPGETPTAAEELRALIHEAHQAIRELGGLIETQKRVFAEGADQARGAAYRAGSDEVGRFVTHLNGEMSAAMMKFDAIVNRSRQAVIASIRPRMVQIDPTTGWVTVQFDGQLPGELHQIEPPPDSLRS